MVPISYALCPSASARCVVHRVRDCETWRGNVSSGCFALRNAARDVHPRGRPRVEISTPVGVSTPVETSTPVEISTLSRHAPRSATAGNVPTDSQSAGMRQKANSIRHLKPDSETWARRRAAPRAPPRRRRAQVASAPPRRRRASRRPLRDRGAGGLRRARLRRHPQLYLGRIIWPFGRINSGISGEIIFRGRPACGSFCGSRAARRGLDGGVI